MPVYDFICDDCGCKEERICSMSERKQQVCKCGSSNPMRQGITAPKLHGLYNGGAKQADVPFEDFDTSNIVPGG